MIEYVTIWRGNRPTKLRLGKPVVRCRDCESARDHYEGMDVWWCDYLRMYVNSGDYCVWGARRVGQDSFTAQAAERMVNDSEKNSEKKPKEE